VNAALMASQSQHGVRTVSLNPTINGEDEAGQTAITVFQAFGMTRPEIEPKPTSFGGAFSTNCTT